MKKPFALSLVLCAFLAGSLHAQRVDYPDPSGPTSARTFPFSMIGQLEFASGRDYYVGSGTVIRPSSVLTAAHNLWDPYSGWSTDILFTRSRYDDNGLSHASLPSGSAALRHTVPAMPVRRTQHL